jgi:hypothetical protein
MFQSILQHGPDDKKTFTVKEEPGNVEAVFLNITCEMNGDTVSLGHVLTLEEVRELQHTLLAWLVGESPQGWAKDSSALSLADDRVAPRESTHGPTLKIVK